MECLKGKHTVGDKVREAVDSVEDDNTYPDIPQSVPQFIDPTVAA